SDVNEFVIPAESSRVFEGLVPPSSRPVWELNSIHGTDRVTSTSNQWDPSIDTSQYVLQYNFAGWQEIPNEEQVPVFRPFVDRNGALGVEVHNPSPWDMRFATDDGEAAFVWRNDAVPEAKISEWGQ